MLRQNKVKKELKMIQKNESGFSHMMVVGLLLVVAVIGFTGWRVMSTNSDNNNVSLSVDTKPETDEVEQLPDDLDGLLNISEIQSLAEVEGEIQNIELKYEDGKTVYIVYFRDGSLKAYSAENGEVFQYSSEEDELEEGDAIPLGYIFGVSIQDAVRIARDKRPNSAVHKVEIEVEDGVVVFSVRFTDDSRVDVNAGDGSINRIKTDNRDDDNEDQDKQEHEDHDDKSDHEDSNDDDDHEDEDGDHDDDRDDREEHDDGGDHDEDEDHDDDEDDRR